MKKSLLLILTLLLGVCLSDLIACTGITLRTLSTHPITARTIEWAAEPLNAMYVIVPRGQKQRSWLPDGTANGKIFTAEYGYVGIAVENDESRKLFAKQGFCESAILKDWLRVENGFSDVVLVQKTAEKELF